MGRRKHKTQMAQGRVPLQASAPQPSLPPASSPPPAHDSHAHKAEPNEVPSATPLASNRQPEACLAEAVPLEAWHITGAAITGLAHWRERLPCQDAVHWHLTPRPILALSDGAGSAKASQLGAQTLVVGLGRFLASLEEDIAPWLDGPQEDERLAAQWSRRLLIHARGLLEDLARQHARPVADFRATALIAIVGQRRIYCWQAGDGAIVARRCGRLVCLATGTKGEYANTTEFVDTMQPENAWHGVYPAAEIQALALLSDGGAERLVAHDGTKVAVRLGQWFEALQQGRLAPQQLAVAFHKEEMWERSTWDDRGIVLAAREEVTSGKAATISKRESAPAVAVDPTDESGTQTGLMPEVESGDQVTFCNRE